MKRDCAIASWIRSVAAASCVLACLTVAYYPTRGDTVLAATSQRLSVPTADPLPLNAVPCGGPCLTPFETLSTAALTTTVPSYLTHLSINAGAGAVGHFQADRNYIGGFVYRTTHPVRTKGIAHLAPAPLYQSERVDRTFAYTLPGLAPSAVYTVRLHFAELNFDAAGQCVFNVEINGQIRLRNFDVYRAAGGRYIAVVRTVATRATPQGIVTIRFLPVVDYPKLSGLEFFLGNFTGRPLGPNI